VQEALRHVRRVFPELTQVFFGVHGNWLYFTDDMEAPGFDGPHGSIDVTLLEEAASAAAEEKGLPCAYYVASDIA
jgi:hypothetical protein